jgi:hypothetical protein
MESMMLNDKNLTFAGWLSIAGAVMAIPLVALGVMAGMAGDESVAMPYLQAFLSMGALIIYVYIFVMFRRLLNEKAGFHKADKYITLLIWFNVIVTVISVILIPVTEAQDVIGIAVLLLLIPLGIVYVVVGVKLLHCEDDLFGYLKPFSYLTIATGVMTAVVVLMLLGVVTSIIADVLLAVIFFKAAKQIKTQGAFIKSGL